MLCANPYNHTHIIFRFILASKNKLQEVIANYYYVFYSLGAKVYNDVTVVKHHAESQSTNLL